MTTPKRGTEWFDTALLKQTAAKAAVCFMPFIPAARERVHIFFKYHLILHIVFLPLMLDIFPDYFFIAPHHVYVVTAASNVPASVFVF